MLTLPFVLGLLASTSVLAQEPILPPNTAIATYTAETVRTEDGLDLAGQLAIPTGKQGPFPAVLLLLGSGPDNRYEGAPGSVTADKRPALLFKGIEDELLARGIAVFTYDKRGVSPKDSTFLENTVNWDIFSKTADAEHLASDALHAFDLVKTLPLVDPGRISVLGHSEGTALAMKIAEKRPEVKSLLMLGLFTRALDQVMLYQGVTNKMRIFALIDIDNDGYITRDEYQPFRQESPENFLAWEDSIVDGKPVSGLASIFDKTGDGRISEQEWRYLLEQEQKAGEALIRDPSKPWPMKMPRAWLTQYYAEGDYLHRHLPFCSKMHVFQGEIDIQTPFEDALELKDNCEARGAPLASFNSYPGEGHAFSPRTGLRGWRDTIGPMDPKTQRDIAIAAAKDLIP